ncbi:hypothetical protein [Spiroplasma endosymbiont of Tricholauxania praeusta]
MSKFETDYYAMKSIQEFSENIGKLKNLKHLEISINLCTCKKEVK